MKCLKLRSESGYTDNSRLPVSVVGEHRLCSILYANTIPLEDFAVVTFYVRTRFMPFSTRRWRTIHAIYTIDEINGGGDIDRLDTATRTWRPFAYLLPLSAPIQCAVMTNWVDFRWEICSRTGFGNENAMLDSKWEDGVGSWTHFDSNRRIVRMANTIYSNSPYAYISEKLEWEFQDDGKLREVLRMRGLKRLRDEADSKR